MLNIISSNFNVSTFILARMHYEAFQDGFLISMWPHMTPWTSQQYLLLERDITLNLNTLINFIHGFQSIIHYISL